MREIKFRIWDKCNERMVEPRNILKICMSRLNQEPYLIVYLKKWMNPNREIREIDKCYTNEFELMQYTGLKDKNGTEIYEGDIVTGLFNHTDIIGHIVYGSDATFFIKRKGLYGIGLNNAEDWLDVIGNIYENQELLKE